MSSSPTPLRCALIGYGAWGGHHARAMSKTDGMSLVAICSRSAESRRRAAEDFPNAAIYGDFAEMLGRESLDVVDIVLPSHLHHQATRAALEARCHVLLEKPMALTLSDCDDLIRLARENNLRLAVGHELRLSSLWGRAKELIDQGAIGDPLYALIELWRRPYRLGSDGWRYDLSRVGSWILEEPIHFFDLARWYLARVGEPHSIYAVANGRQAGHPELHDNFSAILRYPSGPYVVISQTLAAWEHHQTAKVTGTRGSLWARWSGAMDRTLHPTFSLHLQQGDSGAEVPIDKITGEVFELEDQMAMLVRAIRDGAPLSCTGEDGRWSVAACLAAQRSLEMGVPVPIESAMA